MIDHEGSSSDNECVTSKPKQDHKATHSKPKEDYKAYKGGGAIPSKTTGPRRAATTMIDKFVMSDSGDEDEQEETSDCESTAKVFTSFLHIHTSCITYSR